MEVIHLTYSTYWKSIIKDGFITSVHKPEQQRIMWLGDGVYFYNNADEHALRQGKSMLQGKLDKPSKIIVGIKANLDVKDDDVMNILDEEDKTFIIGYLKWKSLKYQLEGNNDLAESMQELETAIRHIHYFLPFDNESHGKKLGNLINELLTEVRGITIKVVSCSFVTAKRYSGQKSKAIEQHCVKDKSIIRNLSKVNI